MDEGEKAIMNDQWINIIPVRGETGFFSGTWVAVSGSKEYELYFEKSVYGNLSGERLGSVHEKLWGRMAVRENGVLIMETPTGGFNSFINFPRVVSPFHIRFRYHVSQRDFWGCFDFIIDENDPTEAVCRLGEPDEHSKGWYDIPDGLSFRKIE